MDSNETRIAIGELLMSYGQLSEEGIDNEMTKIIDELIEAGIEEDTARWTVVKICALSKRKYDLMMTCPEWLRKAMGPMERKSKTRRK